MKKSFPVNISGRIYYFDEDAYERLNNYYTNLRRTFTSADGAEIVNDIETRVAEILSDQHPDNDQAVVSLNEVDEIITRMGSPEELADGEHAENEPRRGATPPPYHGNALENDRAPKQKRLFRDMQDKVIAGVISGLSYYLGVNVTALRIIIVILAVVSYLWPLVILYIIGWLLIPAAETPRQILEMTGQNVTIDSIGRTTIMGNQERRTKSPDNFWPTVGRVFSVVCMSILGFIGAIVSFVTLFILAMAISALISYAIWGSFKYFPQTEHPLPGLIALLLLSIIVLIPAISAVWAACCTLFNAKGVSRSTAIVVAAIEFLLIIAALTLWHVTIQNSIDLSEMNLQPQLKEMTTQSVTIAASMMPTVYLN